jgi:cytochrome c oxidase cbb3-type subunit 4
MELINHLRAAMTVITFLVFLGIVWFAYSRRNRVRFDEAARLPFTDDAALVPHADDGAPPLPATAAHATRRGQA